MNYEPIRVWIRQRLDDHAKGVEIDQASLAKLQQHLGAVDELSNLLRVLNSIEEIQRRVAPYFNNLPAAKEEQANPNGYTSEVGGH